MKFAEERGSGNYLIRGYRPGQLTVNAEVLEASVVIAPNELVRDWPPARASEITAAHMEVIARLEPEVVLLGTGERQEFPELALIRELIVRGIGVEVMDTAAAARTFNILTAEERRVVAGLLLG